MKSTIVVRTLLLSAFLGAGAAADPAFAQININIGVAPPAPQYEVVPSIAPGYIWAPGYWAWNGDRHIWMRGRPILQRTGYRWEPDRWEQRGNGYYRHEGRWEQEKQKKPKKGKHGHKHDD
jgi:hypothetical protein